MKIVQPGGILGFEAAGTVEKLGSSVQGLSLGDKVAFAFIGSSKFCDCVINMLMSWSQLSITARNSFTHFRMRGEFFCRGGRGGRGGCIEELTSKAKGVSIIPKSCYWHASLQKY